MATIDLIVLGMLKKEALSAYDIQKLVEYRNISKWVKISTPSIYKKVIQLEEKGYISSNIVKEGKMPEKAIYSLTEAGEKQLENLMFEIVRAGFNMRRKTLWNAAKTLKVEKEKLETAFEKSGIDPKRRAETLTLEEFAKLADSIYDVKNN